MQLKKKRKLFYVISGQQLLVKQRAAFTGDLKKKKRVFRGSNVINSVENDKS